MKTVFYACIFVATLLISSKVSYADEWTDYIQYYERADAKTQKERLPGAYRRYAMHLSKNDPNESERYMEKAIALDPANSKYRQEMARLLYQHASRMYKDRNDNDHQNRSARKRLERALTYDKDYGWAHELLGDIAYHNQDLHGAKLSWTRARLLDPSDSRVKRKLANMEAEASEQESFQRESLAFFDVRYGKGITPATAVALREYLEVVREQVGKDFRYFPRHKLIVLAYPKDGFNRVSNKRGMEYTGGFYNQEIHVPIANSDLSKIKPTLTHEYTHAIFHDITGRSDPRWLNEGLAELEKSKVAPVSLHLLRRAVQQNKLIPLKELKAPLARKGQSEHNTISLAYQQSFSLVKYLEVEYGFRQVRRVLDHLSKNKSIDEALIAVLGFDTLQLEQEWKNWVPELVR